MFEAFSQGYDLREIVIALQLPPTAVRALYAEWQVSLREGEQHRQDAAWEAAQRKHQREFENSLRGRVKPTRSRRDE